MKTRLKLLMILPLTVALATAAKETGLEITNVPARAIVLSSSATAQETAARKELAAYLEKMSGVQLENRSWSPEMKNEKGLIVMGSAAVKAGGFTQMELDQVLNDGYRVRVKEGNVYLAGPHDWGTFYAVYYLLERLGARFHSADCEVIPPPAMVRIPEMDALEKPFFEFRLIDSGTRKHGELSFANDVGDPSKADPELQKKWGSIPWEHTSQFLVPVDYYGKEHPEYYAQTEDGKFLAKDWLSAPHPGQIPWNLHLCLSNPQVRKIAKERLLMWIKKQPERRFFVVMQMDGYDWCQCAKCRALDTAPGQVTSDRLLDFVNDLAGAVAQKYPDKIILTAAYTSFTAQPPVRVKPAPNVRVMWCPYPPETPCQSHGLKCEKNKVGYEWYKGWLKWCPDQLCIYDYPLSDGLLLEFLHEGISEKMRMYANDGIRGIYFCGRPFLFRPLFDDVKGRLMWNPKADEPALIRAFMNDYFGAAGPQMTQFYELLAQASASPDLHQGAAGDARELASVDLVRQSLALFAKAEENVKDNLVFKQRLGREKSFVLYSDIVQRNPVKGEMPDGIEAFGKRLAEYLALDGSAAAPPPFFDMQDADSIRGWFWRTARLKVETTPWTQDPVVKQLMADPMSVLKTDVAANRALEVLPDHRGWRIPLELFEGGQGPQKYDYECPSRVAVWIYGKLTKQSNLRADFSLEKVPEGKAKLVLEAQDEDKPGTTRIRVALNGHELFRGPNGFVKHNWSSREFPLSPGALQAGKNQLLIENMEETANVQSEWFMLAEARIEITP